MTRDELEREFRELKEQSRLEVIALTGKQAPSDWRSFKNKIKLVYYGTLYFLAFVGLIAIADLVYIILQH